MATLLQAGRNRIGGDDLVEVAGRSGLVARAVLWIVMGSLAVRLAFAGHSEPGATPDRSGALETVARQPLGTALLVALLVGFAAMTLWSVVEAVQKRDGKRSGHVGHRLSAAGRGVLYAGLTASSATLLRGHSSDSNSGATFTARAFGWPGGRLLVGAAGLALLAAAAFNLYRAVTKRYEKHWDRSRMDAAARRVAGPVEAIANVGHAAAFALVGWFLLLAAWHFDPNAPKGLDQSLAALVQRSYGRPLCLFVALGMIAWGLGSLAQARWREVPAD